MTTIPDERDDMPQRDPSPSTMVGIGRRIEIPVHYDLWMQGARFGVIRHITADGTWLLRMDNKNVRKQVAVPPDDQGFCKLL